MVILSVFYKHKEGGFNKRLYRMYKALAETGHEVHYVSCTPFPVSHDHIHHHCLRVPFSDNENLLFWMLFCILAPLRALFVAKSIKAEKVVVFGAWYALFAYLPKLFFGCQLLLFLRADGAVVYENEKRSFLARWCNFVLEYFGLAAADKVWTNIGSVRNSVIERYHLLPEKVGTLYNNIDRINNVDDRNRFEVRNELGLDNTAFIIATSGIFYKRKNIAFLIRAFHEAALMPHSTLLIIGDDVGQGNEKCELQRTAAELRIDRQVLFTGWRSDSQALLGASDLFVLPTLHEGFPNSLLDAMAVGCPCLGSRIEEIAEVLESDELLFSLSSTGELVRKLRKAAEDPSYLETLSCLTMERAERFRFDWDSEIVNLISKTTTAA